MAHTWAVFSHIAVDNNKAEPDLKTKWMWKTRSKFDKYSKKKKNPVANCMVGHTSHICHGFVLSHPLLLRNFQCFGRKWWLDHEQDSRGVYLSWEYNNFQEMRSLTFWKPRWARWFFVVGTKLVLISETLTTGVCVKGNLPDNVQFQIKRS